MRKNSLNYPENDNICPFCDTHLVHKVMCINCYKWFNYTPRFSISTKYKEEKLYKLENAKDRLDKNYHFVVIFGIHLVLTIFLFIQILYNYRIIIFYDVLDSLIIACLIGIYIIKNRIIRSIINRIILEKDLQSRIRFSLTRYNHNKLDLLSYNDFSQIQQIFQSEETRIDNLKEKYFLGAKRNRKYFYLFTVSMVSSVVFFWLNFDIIYILLLIFIGIFFLYPIYQKKYNKYLKELFRLNEEREGNNINIQDCEIYINYIYNVIVYSQTHKKQKSYKFLKYIN